MLNDSSKRVTTEVSKECFKQLKIMSITKEVSLPEVVKQILERTTKKGKSVEVDEVS